MNLPPVGLGTMGIEDPDVIATALECGYRHLDTAQIYGNEAVVGAGLERSDVPREAITVATKVWADNLESERVRQSTHDSARKLGLETIDLLYVHRPIESYEPEATLPAFDTLRDEGHIKGVGLSNFTLQELETARAVLESPIGAHQIEYHPLFATPELLEHARKHVYPVVAYSPLAAGRARELEVLVDIANRHGTTPEAVSLAWVLQHDTIVAIPKASTRAHLEANLEAATLELTPDEVARIDGIEREEELFPE
ncbi:aldo/keto reductase [Halobacteria archaeon AArc-curdl1]|uniref:Aldo/keto reductase n=1 Tax=Natronosalvus hydrolyticus TaxID=2979988 RepID=A0AAP2ZC96_9EURY|nr:aldo/keto reductase [Halobacteria archaeon AArc-curdl1]